MKFDKETVFAMILCIAVVIAWGVYSKKHLESQQKLADNTDKISVPQSKNDTNKTEAKADNGQGKNELSSTDEKISKNGESTIPDSAKIAKKIQTELPSEFLKNEYIQCEISPSHGFVKSVRFEKYLDQMRSEKLSFGNGSYNFGALKASFGTDYEILDTTVEKNEKLLVISKKIKVKNSVIDFTQIFEISGQYVIRSSIKLHNTSENNLVIDNFAVSAGAITNFQHMAGDTIRQEYFSLDMCLAAGNTVKSKPFKGKHFDERQENPARWVSLSNKYFCSILLPGEVFQEGNTMVADTKNPNLPLISGEGLIDLNIKAGETRELSYSIYAGPKERKLLKMFDPDASKIMHLGWNWLEPISQLLLSFLVILNKYAANYGLSIIILTLLVKLVFWPITEKANSSMKNMQKLQPMVLEIKEKYKNDPQKMNMKVMELYKEHGVNPLGGCFPILLQIPVFFALYNTLSGAIELRQSAFLWAQDLSRPDSLYIPGIPLPINPLALAMAATMFIQQKMTPSSADPAQQKIMAFMPLIMLFMLYNLPSGLTLYWTVSQLISIAQLAISTKMPLLKKKGTV